MSKEQYFFALKLQQYGKRNFLDLGKMGTMVQ